MKLFQFQKILWYHGIKENEFTSISSRNGLAPELSLATGIDLF